jgi:hypothetical protein
MFFPGTFGMSCRHSSTSATKHAMGERRSALERTSCIPPNGVSYETFDFLRIQTSTRIKPPHSYKDFRLLQLRVRKQAP